MGALKLWEQALSRVCAKQVTAARISRGLILAFCRILPLKIGRQLCSTPPVCMQPLGTLSLHRLHCEVCCVPCPRRRCLHTTHRHKKPILSSAQMPSIVGWTLKRQCKAPIMSSSLALPRSTLHAITHCNLPFYHVQAQKTKLKVLHTLVALLCEATFARSAAVYSSQAFSMSMMFCHHTSEALQILTYRTAKPHCAGHHTAAQVCTGGQTNKSCCGYRSISSTACKGCHKG